MERSKHQEMELRMRSRNFYDDISNDTNESKNKWQRSPTASLFGIWRWRVPAWKRYRRAREWQRRIPTRSEHTKHRKRRRTSSRDLQDEIQFAVDSLKKGMAAETKGIRVEDLKECNDTSHIQHDHRRTLYDIQCLKKDLSDLQRGRSNKTRKLQTSIRIADTAQTFLHRVLQRTAREAWQNAKTWPGWFPQTVPHDRHLTTYRLMAQSKEWRIHMWIATVDFW